jgi:hypothetical protein
MTKLRNLTLRFSTAILATAVEMGGRHDDYLPGLIRAIGKNPTIEELRVEHCVMGFNTIRTYFDKELWNQLKALPSTIQRIHYKGTVRQNVPGSNEREFPFRDITNQN